MCSRKELQPVLEDLVKVYREVYGTDIVRVVLYGSYARGDNTDESDVDIAAIVKGDRASLQKKLKRVWDVSSDMEIDLGTVLSPTVIPYNEFQQYKDVLPYYRNINQEGIVLDGR